MTLNRLKHKKFGVLLVNSFLSQRDDDSQLPEVLERIEEVVLASQDLPEVAQTIRRLSELIRTQFVLGLHDILHAIVMRISSVKTVL